MTDGPNSLVKVTLNATYDSSRAESETRHCAGLLTKMYTKFVFVSMKILTFLKSIDIKSTTLYDKRLVTVFTYV